MQKNTKYYADGRNHTCGHKHRTAKAAYECGVRSSAPDSLGCISENWYFGWIVRGTDGSQWDYSEQHERLELIAAPLTK